MLLINDIEHSEYSLKVDSWNVTPMKESQPVRGFGEKAAVKSAASEAGENVKVKFILKISSIEMLGNEKKQRKE